MGFVCGYHSGTRLKCSLNGAYLGIGSAKQSVLMYEKHISQCGPCAQCSRRQHATGDLVCWSAGGSLNAVPLLPPTVDEAWPPGTIGPRTRRSWPCSLWTVGDLPTKSWESRPWSIARVLQL